MNSAELVRFAIRVQREVNDPRWADREVVRLCTLDMQLYMTHEEIVAAVRHGDKEQTK